MVAAQTGPARPRSRPPGRVAVRYASFESRVAAAMLDAIVAMTIIALCILAGSLVVLFSSDFERVKPSDTALYTFWGLAGVALPAVGLYLFVGLAWKGQTLGSAIMQIMAIRSDGRPLGVGGAMARVVGLLFYPLIMVVGGAVGYAFGGTGAIAAVAVGVAGVIATAAIIWAAFDSRRRMLHDRLAGTIIVRLA